MDLDAVRTFVAVVDTGRFAAAADEESVTQQAVSKRIAALEKDLGVRLFTRTARGARLTVDGQAFLPSARELLQAAERAAASVRPGRRALRVDVINPRIGSARLLRESGEIDASFRAVTVTAPRLPDGIEVVRALDDPLQLLVGPAHELAAARAVTPAGLAGHRIWMPGIVPGTEWAAFYDELAAAFGLTIDAVGPNFGTDAMLEAIAGSPSLATFVSEQMRLVWPAHYDLRRIAVRDPAPVYPHSLIWRRGNPHPALAALRGYLRTVRPAHRDAGTWTPTWARGGLRCMR